MLVSRIICKPVRTITPDTPVRAAAVLMGELCIGALPVCINGRPVGIVTDRDIAIRWASRLLSDCPVALIMTRRVVTCLDSQTIEKAAHLMSASRIRRLVVLDHQGMVAGLISLGDIAKDASEELAGQTLGEIVERL